MTSGDAEDSVSRRGFVTALSSGAAVVVGAGSATAQSGTTTDGSDATTSGDGGGNGTGTTAAESDGGGTGSTEEVVVGPDGEFVFDPAELEIRPGTTVRWVWDSNNHNVVVDDQPEGVEWEGTEGGAGTTYDAGHTYEFTFEQEGTYEYACEPHRAAGMLGTVVVSQDAGAEAGGRGEIDPEEMGVPYQAHYVGIATILAIVVSLLFTFFLLKYGESSHTSSPNRR
jgi:plastocyanin